MIKNYLRIAFRNLVKNKGYSFINIMGLSVGMAVTMLIGFWIRDELSFDKYHKNYHRIAEVRQNVTFNGEIHTWASEPLPLGDELRNSYGSNFKYVLMSSSTDSHILAFGEKKFTKSGNYMEPEAPEMLSLKMLRGTRAGLKDPASVLICESLAKAFFGNADAVNKILKIDNKIDVKVTGVYEDLPYNSSFAEVTFIAPWKLLLSSENWIKEMENPWSNNAFQVFVQIADNANMNEVSERIKNAKLNKIKQDEIKYKPEIFLYPMSQWHLYPEFKNGVNVGGRIQFVWLFGSIGIFILLLACINFMNLSTAHSEKRAKEVGIRKAIGSLRGQLISQFFSESLVVTAFAFVFSLLLLQLIFPFFNEVTGKKMSILWSHPVFWLFGIGFSLITGLIAGSYPALYLSSFQPVKVLKGTFRAGRFAALPRKVLVVLQFTVSVTLIISTIIVFRQIQSAKNRPIGYNTNGLIMLHMATPDIHNHFDAVRDELKNSGVAIDMAESVGPLTAVWRTYDFFDWKGKDPGLAVDFPVTSISYGYGKTVGWQFKEGRDFSKEFSTDSAGLVLNEAAVKFMGLKNAVGETIKWDGQPFKVIGVIKDMLVESPYEPVRPSLYCVVKNHDNFVIIKMNSAINVREALSKIETIFKKYSPVQPFDYQFVDEEYGKKFGNEERMGRLINFFAILAIFISCLGLFGMASFMAEQRTKEIGVRKVLGASVTNLWGMLSKDFVVLVVLSCFIAVPIGWYFMNKWLENFAYRVHISWQVFVASGMIALMIALLTVNFQAIRAAIANPVKSLRTE